MVLSSVKGTYAGYWLSTVSPEEEDIQTSGSLHGYKSKYRIHSNRSPRSNRSPGGIFRQACARKNKCCWEKNGKIL